MNIIPSIDLMNGMCVRLRQGKFDEGMTYYRIKPLDYAKMLEDNGATQLHIVDLHNAGTTLKSAVHFDIINSIAASTNLKIDVGGGIKTTYEIETYLNVGVEKVCIGTISVTKPDATLNIIDMFGADKIILCPDTCNNKVAIHGWKTITDVSIFDYIKNYRDKGVTDFICTDIKKDGMLQGSSIDLYESILKENPSGLNLIASGGVSSIHDIERLDEIGVSSVIIGKALFEKRIELKDLTKWL